MVLATIVCGLVPSALLAQASLTSKRPISSISGRVTVNGKGRGGIIVGAQVGNFQSHTPARTAETDADGAYRISNVPPGTYYVAPLATSFVLTDQNSMGFQGKSLIVGESETIEGIDFAMVRGAVITGKVTLEDGSPVIEEPVFVDAVDTPNGRNSYSAPIMFQTDDRGVYRLFGLRPGRYRVAVGQSDADAGPYRGRMKYQRVYYPNVNDANIDKAKIIELSEGDQATDIDIVLPNQMPGFTATGAVVSAETNQPLPNARVMIRKLVNDQPSFVLALAVTNQRGEFRFENLAPGNYDASVFATSDTNLRSDAVRFEITDQNVNGLVVRGAQGSSISGNIVVEGDSNPALAAKLGGMRIYVGIRTQGVGSGVPPVIIGTDGSFRVTSLPPGTANFQLVNTNAQRARFNITRIERDGVTVPRGAFEVKAGEDISGVRLIVAYSNGSVRGVVNFENGPPVDSHVYVRLASPESTASVYVGGELDAKGRFLIESVPPGSYDLIVSAVSTLRAGPPAVLAKKSIIVTQDATSEVNISVDTPPSP